MALNVFFKAYRKGLTLGYIVALLVSANGLSVSAAENLRIDGAKGPPFGIRLGEVVESCSNDLNQTSLRGFPAGDRSAIISLRRALSCRSIPGFSDSRCTDEILDLGAPFFGISQTKVSFDSSRRAFSFEINGAFRRGLPRQESLEKINGLRKEVIRRAGFEIGEYRFSTKSSDAGVLASEGGSAMWMDMDTVFAGCVTTNQDLEVEVRCSVNPFDHDADAASQLVHVDAERAMGYEGGDSKVSFSVVVTKLSVRNAEIQRQRDERAHAQRLEDLSLAEFFGVRFDKSNSVATNVLVRKEFEGSSWSDNSTNHFLKAYWERIDKSLCPAPFFDFAKVTYSYETITARNSVFFGHFTTNVTRKASVILLDAFARELADRYGIELKANSLTTADEEPSSAPAAIPEGIGCDETFYWIPRKADYYCREFQNNHLYVSLCAGENQHGTRCVVLQVRPYSGKSDREGIVKEW